MKLKIVIKAEHGASVTNVMELNGNRLVVGRQDADILLSDPHCSKQHAVIYESNHEIRIADTESTNGVFVGGKRVGDCKVSIGQEIKVGHTLMVILDCWTEEQSNANSDVNICTAWPNLLSCLPPSFQKQVAQLVDPKER